MHCYAWFATCTGLVGTRVARVVHSSLQQFVSGPARPPGSCVLRAFAGSRRLPAPPPDERPDVDFSELRCMSRTIGPAPLSPLHMSGPGTHCGIHRHGPPCSIQARVRRARLSGTCGVVIQGSEHVGREVGETRLRPRRILPPALAEGGCQVSLSWFWGRRRLNAPRASQTFEFKF